MSEQSTVLYCYNHPTIETSLRCNRCERPICPKCAIATPTGYRCKECVKGQQKVFETALWYDYVSSGLAAVAIAGFGSWIVPKLGFFTIFISPIAGVIIAEVCRMLIRKRRSINLYKFIAIAAFVGSLPLILLYSLGLLIGTTGFGFGSFLEIGFQALFSFLMTSTVYYRLSGINLKF